MPFDLPLQDLGENIESGDVIEILVAEGDVIAVDQEVLEVETDKAVMPVPSTSAGKVLKIYVKKGDTVPIGTPILQLESAEGSESGEAASSEPPAASKSEEAKQEKDAPKQETESKQAEPAEEAKEDEAEEEPQSEEKAPAQTEAGAAERTARSPVVADRSNDTLPPPASPDTRRYARELGVDLNTVSGSGPGGRITKEDVKKAVRSRIGGSSSRSAPAEPSTISMPPAGGKSEPATDPTGEDKWGPVRVERLSKIRATIAKNMAYSGSTIPHVTNFDDADITELERIRKGSMADYVGDVKLTMMSFLMKSIALALRQHEAINASLDLEANEIIYKQYVNLGVAVDTDRGLVVPVMRDVDQLSIPQIAKQLIGMSESARSGRFALDDIRGGTFTISNLGAIGGTYSTPIINHPEVAILLVGRSRKLPVVVKDTVEIRLMMPLSLSYDHRLVDGATAARFLNEVIGYLESPGRLLLAP